MPPVGHVGSVKQATGEKKHESPAINNKVTVKVYREHLAEHKISFYPHFFHA